jgi:uncharacterized protein YjbJ (UPF0337 family)
MAATGTAKNSAERAKGKVRETAGKVTGDDSLRAEGEADQVKGSVKQAGKSVKDAFTT